MEHKHVSLRIGRDATDLSELGVLDRPVLHGLKSAAERLRRARCYLLNFLHSVSQTTFPNAVGRFLHVILV